MQPPSDFNPQPPSYNAPIPPVPLGKPGDGMPPGAPPGGYPPNYSGPPQIRFELIGEAWTLFQQQMGTWVLATLVYFMLVAIPGMLCAIPFWECLKEEW